MEDDAGRDDPGSVVGGSFREPAGQAAELLEFRELLEFVEAPLDDVAELVEIGVESTPTTNATFSPNVPGESSSTITCSGIRSPVPSAVHNRNRSYAVFHGPYRPGTPRHAAPARPFHTTASI
ncbi:hypothetical protein Q5530_11850 [Saccharothrix sp. BKS2]